MYWVPVNMSWILSISSHYSPLCWWKRAVSVDFCSSYSFRVSHLLCCLCWGWLWLMQGIATWGEILTRNWSTTYSVVADSQIKPIITAKSKSPSCLSDSLICLHLFQLFSVAFQTSGQLKNICLHWLVFVRLYGGQTKSGYWHRTGKGPRHKHYIFSPTQEAAQQWQFFTLLRKCVSVFVHSTLESTQM